MDEVLTVKDVAKIIKCNPQYVYKLRDAGLIKFMYLGSLKCRRSELERFLKEAEGKDLSDPFNVRELAI